VHFEQALDLHKEKRLEADPKHAEDEWIFDILRHTE